MNAISADNRRLAMNTLILYFRSMFILLVSLYTSRVTLQVLGVSDFGVYQVVGGVVSLFSMLSATLASASQRFITYTLGLGDRQRLRMVFSNCLTLHLLLGILVVILIEVFGLWFLNQRLNIAPDRMVMARWVFHVNAVTFFVEVFSLPYIAVIVAHEKMTAFAYFSILGSLLELGAVFLLSCLSWDKLVLYAVLMFAISILKRVLFSVYSRIHFQETRQWTLKVDSALFKEMFSFALWNLWGNGTKVLRTQGIDILLNLFFGVLINAAKGICNSVQAAVEGLVNNFLTALRPQLTKAVAQGEKERIFRLVLNGTRYSFMMMMILAVPIIVSAPQLLRFWLGEVPDYASVLVQWTMAYLLLDSMSRMLIHALLSDGRIKNCQIVIGGTKLLAIPLAYVMLLFGAGPLAGVWVNIVLDVFCLWERLYFMRKLLGFDGLYFLRSVLLKCAVQLAVSLGLSYCLTCLAISALLPSVTVSLTFCLGTAWLVGLNRRERVLVWQYALRWKMQLVKGKGTIHDERNGTGR